MTKEEIALQLTLKAMETGYIVRETGSESSEAGQHNTTAVSNFFKAMCKAQVDDALGKYESLYK